MDKEDSWLKNYWRPIMAYQYAFVCLFDFVIAPCLMMALSYFKGVAYVWEPLTLKESGFYHLSMAAIVGTATWTRGQEKITRILNGGKLEESSESTTIDGGK